MSNDPDQQSLYHPENPAAIAPVHQQPAFRSHAPASRQFVWGMVGNAISILLAIAAPVTGFFFILLTPLGIAFAVMGTTYSSSVLAEARAAGMEGQFKKLGLTCRIVGYSAMAVHVLSGAAWLATNVLGVSPILW
ncbi:MAG: hypothetical protein MPJ50_07185 [Pirellulales bacterium]|nr:hypothetical protein [Pirellulales bacterium]